MSSERVGVQAIIKKVSPKAIYTHCSSHCLNLVIGTSCNLPEIRNTLDRMKCTVNFFIFSPKREKLLDEVMTSHSHPVGRRKALIDVCRTRWAARHDAYSHFYQAYSWIVTSFEVIAFGAHQDLYSEDVTLGWEPKYKAEANSLLISITSFEFIVTFLTVYNFLSHWKASQSSCKVHPWTSLKHLTTSKHSTGISESKLTNLRGPLLLYISRLSALQSLLE